MKHRKLAPSIIENTQGIQIEHRMSMEKQSFVFEDGIPDLPRQCVICGSAITLQRREREISARQCQDSKFMNMRQGGSGEPGFLSNFSMTFYRTSTSGEKSSVPVKVADYA